MNTTYVLGRTPTLQQAFWRLVKSGLRVEGIDALVIDDAQPQLVAGATSETVRASFAPPPGWRESWGIHLSVASESGERSVGFLSAGVPSVELAASPPARLIAQPAFRTTPSLGGEPPAGCPPVTLSDAGFGRVTRQSSVEGAAALHLWMAPTAAEASPWWEVDFGQQLFLDAVEVHFDPDSPPQGQLEVCCYPYLDPETSQPFFPELAWNALAPLSGAARLQLSVGAVGRFLRLRLRGAAPQALHLHGVQTLAARLTQDRLLASYQRSFTLFAERPLFARRRRLPSGELSGYDRWQSYREVWEEALAARAGLGELLADAPAGAEGRVFVGLFAPNQPEWVVCDLACVLGGWAVAPLAPTDGVERLAGIVERAGIACLIVGPEQLERAREVAARTGVERIVLLPSLDGSPPPAAEGALPYAELLARGAGSAPDLVEREPDELYTVLFTSGSTGTPKGAKRTYRAINALLPAFGVCQPAVHLCFKPLSHFSERAYLPTMLAHGGQVGFGSGGERLFEDLALLRPSAVSGVPRVFNVLMARYEEDLARARASQPERDPDELEEEVLASLRGVFGDRLQSVSVGSAPPSRALMRFLLRCFRDQRVTEGYGSTECGTITVDDVVQPQVDVKLIDVPELGYFADDRPARGEILVKTQHMISGYLGDEETTQRNFDGEGYFRTGDLGERLPDGRVRVIGRRKNVVKLAQGEFVAPERIEGALMQCPLVEQLVVHADSLQASVVALVVPNEGALAAALPPGAGPEGPEARALLHEGLRAAGRAASLLPFELPSAIHVELERLSVERGLATSSNKIDRGAVEARYAEVFRALYAAPQAEVPESVLEAVRRAASEVLGREVAADADLLGELGVDSLAGVELVARVQERLQREVPLDAWYGSATLDELARRIQLDAGVGSAAAAGDSLAAMAREDLARPLELGPLGEPRSGPPRVVLLSGATGFLGAHLLEALLAEPEARVLCLVRGEDPLGRLREARARWELAGELGWDERVEAISGDLALPRLGLDDARWERLAAECDAVLHAGAVVNWVRLYGALRAANVGGTLELLRLAASGRPSAFHHVSTISAAPPGGDEGSTLSEEQALAASPYALSKWIAEEHVRAAQGAGLPAAIYRPAMIAGHSQRGLGNEEDFLNRYLVGVAQLGCALDLETARCDFTPVDFVAGAIARLLLEGELPARPLHLANLEASPTWRQLAEHLAAAGVPLEPRPYPEFRAALLEQPECALTPLRAFFPAQGFGLRMGPWPRARSEALLAERGLSCPVADETLLATYVEALRRRGRISR